MRISAAGLCVVLVMACSGQVCADEAFDRAVAEGLAWLARHQTPSGQDAGCFASFAFSEQCQGAGCLGPSLGEPGNWGPGRGSPRHDVATSALALLAFLGSPDGWEDTIARGLHWLRREQQDGAWPRATGSSRMYSQALATLALSRAVTVVDDDSTRLAAASAVRVLVAAQNDDGGWRYTPRAESSDSSHTGWALAALAAARDAGLEVPAEVFAAARLWLDAVRDERGRWGYSGRGGASSYLVLLDAKLGASMYNEKPAMTAVGLHAGQLCGGDHDPSVALSVPWLLAALPVYRERAYRDRNNYYWYFATLALRGVGGEHWQTWRSALLPALLQSQCDGTGEHPDLAGSWHPLGEWAYTAGRVYTTALSVLTLQAARD